MSGADERIAVDLDGTLLRTDLLAESLLRLVFTSPLGLLRAVGWLLRGRAELKAQVASRVALDVATLPYKAEVVELLRQADEAGARIVLATASARRYADDVAAHLGVFDEVVATEPGGPNLRSEAKAAALRERFGDVPWTYVGDSRADLPVWRQASRAVAVDVPRAVDAELDRLGVPVERIRTAGRTGWRLWTKQLRVHQWAKNVLIFAPLLTAHLVDDLRSVLAAVLAFVSFSLTASSMYVWNDLVDIESDRHHASKRNRPLASGALGIPQVIAAGVLLGLSGFALAAVVGWLFLAALVVYVVATNLYSFWLKRKPMIDAVALATLYAWRVLAGCAAIHVVPTLWLLAFSVFFFFGLALMKRYAESYSHEDRIPGRGYGAPEMPLMMALGTSSGLVSALVVALYIDSDDVRQLYAVPELLWAAIPLLIYWVARTWLVALRGEMDHDPVIFAIRDPISAVVLGLIGVIVVAATLIPL